MSERCHNRLTMVGRARDLKPFDEKGRWPRKVKAQHVELMQFSPTRHVWLFETGTPPLESLKGLSVRWPSLTFLLEYDQQHKRVKGLVRARAGRLEHYRVSY
jgi:hypothetical protein